MSKFRNYSNYEIYTDGKIWSYKYKKFLKPATTKNGYQIVQLSDNEGKAKMYYVHRLVAQAFIENPNNLPCVNHKDENKQNNSVENLEWCTHKYNWNYGTCIERCAKARINGKRSKSVGAFKDGKLVITFPSTNEAQRQGFNQSNVSACCRNCYNREGNNIYKGYEWRYL